MITYVNIQMSYFYLRVKSKCKNKLIKILCFEFIHLGSGNVWLFVSIIYWGAEKNILKKENSLKSMAFLDHNISSLFMCFSFSFTGFTEKSYKVSSFCLFHVFNVHGLNSISGTVDFILPNKSSTVALSSLIKSLITF